MDPISVTAVSLLATALNDLVGEASKSTWTVLTGLVAKIRNRLHADEDGLRALEAAERSPEDKALTNQLALLIDRLISVDESFQADIMSLVKAAQQNHAPGATFITELSGHASVGKVTNIEKAGDVTVNLCTVRAPQAE
jgi:hypothetical protein